MPFGLLSKYNGKYLCYINDDPQLHGFLQFSGDEFPTTHSIFDKEPAKTVDEFINLKFVYNNKYWVSRYKNDEHWIVAEADEPNEDQSSPSCTLFQAIPVDDSGAIRLLHVHLKKYLCLSKDSLAGLVDPGPGPIVDRILKLRPKQFAFKGDNGKYLEVEGIEGIPHLKFSAKNTNDLKVWFECPNITNDTIGPIKSKYNNKFWRRDHKWVHADTDTTSPNDNKTLFYFQWMNDDKTKGALRVDNFYCRRYEDDGGKSSKKDCLIADASEITEQATLHVG